VIPDCPNCGAPLEHRDTLGNLDHCLEAIGHPRDPYSRPRQPRKTGDVWACEACDQSFHTIDGDGEVREGMP
jgi:ribosomal protein L37AE/L43A